MIIGLVGKAGSGKDTVYNILRLLNQKEKVFNTVNHAAFATELKKIATQLNWDGKKDKRGRRFLQLLGTELGRCYNKNTWIDLCFKEIHIHKNYLLKKNPFNIYNLWVITDTRFLNEARAIKKKKGYLVHIKRTEIDIEMDEETKQHSSELEIEKINCKFHINNTGNFDDLNLEVERLYDKLVDIATRTHSFVP